MSNFTPTGSPHSFAREDMVVDVHGIRGIVREASNLYALVRWEDGREEEIEQGDPRVVSEGRDWEEDPLGGDKPVYDRDVREVERSFDLWNVAGPKPEERPLEEEPAIETPSLKVA